MPGPATFTLLFLSTIAPNDYACSRAGFVKFLKNKPKPSEEKGENKHPSSTTIYQHHKPLGSWFLAAGLVSRVSKPSEEGERE
jgi:hypothetical protein